MHLHCCSLVAFVVALPAQGDPLRAAAGTILPELIDRCRTALAHPAPIDPNDPEGDLWRLLGHLRLGDPAAATRALPATAPWSVVGAAVLAQALGTAPLPAARLQQFAAELEPPPEPGDRSFLSAVRRIQAHLAIAALADTAATTGNEAPGLLPSPDDQRDRACAELAALEREFFEPGGSWFRVRRGADAGLAADAADTTSLLSSALTTFWPHDERRIRYHEWVLARALVQPLGHGGHTLDTAAGLLGTACDLGNAAERDLAFARLLAAMAALRNAPLPPATAGRVLDAVAQATSGVTLWPRPATAAWTRLRPWLPDGARTLRLPLLVDGAHCTLHLRGQPAHVAFTLVRTDRGRDPLLVVVDGSAWPAVYQLAAGERCRGSLPRAQTDAHDDLHAFDREAGFGGGRW
jgi:hypothetical protein